MENRVNKADKLADRLNHITEHFAEKLQDAEDLIVCSNDLEKESSDFISNISTVNGSQSLPISEYKFDTNLLPQILNLENMMDDVRYIRNTLKENTDLGRRLLKGISQELEFEPDAELLASYAQLSQTITENMRLFLACYKDISNVLLNISKLSKQDVNAGTVNVNNITIGNDTSNETVQSTAELIKKLTQK